VGQGGMEAGVGGQGRAFASGSGGFAGGHVVRSGCTAAFNVGWG